MLNEWQRAVRGKEEAIWHVQAMHSAEKNSMEAHFLNQINILLTEKHALAEELQQLKGVRNRSGLWVGAPPAPSGLLTDWKTQQGSLGIKEAPTVTSERVTVSAPAVMPPSYSMPVLSQIPYLHVQPAPRPPGPHPTLAADSGVMLQPQAAPAAQAQEPSRQPQQSPGLNWIESLMNGTAHLHASNVPAGDRSVPDVQADVQGSNAHGGHLPL